MPGAKPGRRSGTRCEEVCRYHRGTWAAVAAEACRSTQAPPVAMAWAIGVEQQFARDSSSSNGHVQKKVRSLLRGLLVRLPDSQPRLAPAGWSCLDLSLLGVCSKAPLPAGQLQIAIAARVAVVRHGQENSASLTRRESSRGNTTEISWKFAGYSLAQYYSLEAEQLLATCHRHLLSLACQDCFS